MADQGMTCDVCGRAVLRGIPKCYGPNDTECYRLGYERAQAKLEQAERERDHWKERAGFFARSEGHIVEQGIRTAADWLSEKQQLESALAAAQGAWKALRANILVSDGADKVMRGVWFRGGDAVAQVHAVDAALAAESGNGCGKKHLGCHCVQCRAAYDAAAESGNPEPRAAPPALPAELSGKGEQRAYSHEHVFDTQLLCKVCGGCALDLAEEAAEPGEAKKEEGSHG